MAYPPLHDTPLNTSELQPLRFLDQPIEVFFNSPPVHEKSPPCPDGFVWEDRTYLIVEKLSEWTDFTRRGTCGAQHAPKPRRSCLGPGLVERGPLLLPGAREHRARSST